MNKKAVFQRAFACPIFRIQSGTALALVLALSPAAGFAQEATGTEVIKLDDVRVIGTAEQELRQAPGVSLIRKEDIEKRPPANDLSEIIRRMPGVNLTGNSSTGQYGNNRQIDLRGMGPENTLILVDGRPVSSRNSIRMGRSGERNTRGDTNWVPAEAVERIEVLRGPAAARYGSGAAGGVVNIITKPTTDKLSGSASVYINQPHHAEEGSTRRLGFNLTGPIGEKLSFRVFGNVNKTKADSLDLNREAAGTTGTAVPPAGREGVRNQDIDGMVRWQLSDNHSVDFQAGYSRQGNIYAGDRAVATDGSALLEQLARDGAETNIMLRRTASITHKGEYAGGLTSRLMYQFEGTDNKRLNEGLAGGGEGSINTANGYSTSRLRTHSVDGDLNIPLSLGFEQVLTIGTALRFEELNDPFSMTQSTSGGGAIPGLSTGVRPSMSKAENYAIFIEDNIEVLPGFMVTPALRFDHHSQFGSNWSPSLNASYEVVDGLTIKGGVARAFKAPNLYQSNPNYLYYTRGNGCPLDYPSLGGTGGGCYVQGNANLKPEISLNKEIGVSYSKGTLNTGLTYFHNDYQDKIVSGWAPVGQTAALGRIFRWENSPEAVVEGFEGTFNIGLTDAVNWSNNFTYMLQSKDKRTGQPLSIIPKYTINSWLDWQVTDDWSAQLSLTHYGEQKPRTVNVRGAVGTGAEIEPRKPYTLIGVSTDYKVSGNFRVTAGVSNILDKRLYREANSSGAGANNYNEPGRAYYVTLTSSF